MRVSITQNNLKFIFLWLPCGPTARAKAGDRIVNTGFSFHEYLDTFKDIIEAYNWDFYQIQYNYLDEFNQAGTEGLRFAAEKGLGVVIMEPLRGGALGGKIPPKVREVIDRSCRTHTPAEWALRRVWNHPEVTVVLSGMTEDAHPEENLRIVQDAGPGRMTSEELAVIKEIKSVYNRLLKAGCTACRYCMPCPSGVNIPMCFEIYNRRTLFQENKLECLVKYALHMGGLDKDKNKKHLASNCTECGKCLAKCPQHLDIPNLLKDVRDEFESFTMKMLMMYGRYFFPRLKTRK